MGAAPGLNTSEVVATIVRVVSPYVGETMARSAATAHCRKLGITGERMDMSQAEALLAKMASGLNIFMGRERSALIVLELRRALGTAPAA